MFFRLSIHPLEEWDWDKGDASDISFQGPLSNLLLLVADPAIRMGLSRCSFAPSGHTSDTVIRRTDISDVCAGKQVPNHCTIFASSRGLGEQGGMLKKKNIREPAV